MWGAALWGRGGVRVLGVAEARCGEEEEDGRRSQGVAQVTLLPAAVGARMGWEVTCPPLEEIWGRSRTLNDS